MRSQLSIRSIRRFCYAKQFHTYPDFQLGKLRHYSFVSAVLKLLKNTNFRKINTEETLDNKNLVKANIIKLER